MADNKINGNEHADRGRGIYSYLYAQKACGYPQKLKRWNRNEKQGKRR